MEKNSLPNEIIQTLLYVGCISKTLYVFVTGFTYILNGKFTGYCASPASERTFVCCTPVIGGVAFAPSK